MIPRVFRESRPLFAAGNSSSKFESGFHVTLRQLGENSKTARRNYRMPELPQIVEKIPLA
jgi:hypothetical protein